jgi:hypothetical protein
MKYLIAFIYTGVTTVIYFQHFYREDALPFITFTVPLILYLPILFSNNTVNKLGRLLINGLSIIGFCIGFIFTAILSNINIWPIALTII